MRLSDYLSERGMTAVRLAREVGVSPSTIGRWADGSADPSLSGMRRLFEVTQGAVAPNDFLKAAPALETAPARAGEAA